MTTDIKELVTTLRTDCCRCVGESEYKAVRCYTCEAADALEAIAGERDAWEAAARNHMDRREKNRERANAAESERDRLAGYVAMLRDAMSDIDPYLDDDTEVVQRFRKALEATK